MKLNFSLKNAYEDLISSKKYIWQLLIVTILVVSLELLGELYKIKGPDFLSSIVLGGYLSLISYNIINAKERVLESIFNNKEITKFFLLVGLKTATIDFIYIAAFYIATLPIALILKSLWPLNDTQLAILTPILLFPFFIFFYLMPTTVFSETLKFSDGFKYKKAVTLYKFAINDYLICVFILILIIFGLFAICFLGFTIIFLLKTVQTNSISSLTMKILWDAMLRTHSNIVFLTFSNVIASYFCTHIVAQTYKHSLSTRIIDMNVQSIGWQE